MTIVEATPPTSIDAKLEFGEKMESMAYWRLTPRGDEVEVLWGWQADVGWRIPSRYMGFFIDPFLGPHLQAGLESLKTFIIQLKLHLQGSIGQPPTTLEHGYGLVENLLKRHDLPSTSACAVSVSGSQNVIPISRYISIAVDNSVQACSDCPVWLYRVPRPR